MDFLNKAYGQIVDLFRSMSPGARLTAGLLVVVTGVSLVFLFREQTAGPDAFLLGGERLPASQLADMQAALGKAGIEAAIEGDRIRVMRGQETKAMAALAESNALPAEFGDYLQRAINVNSLYTSRAQQEALAKAAKQRDLQNIINHMRGVDRSAVQIAEETKSGLQSKKIVTASVSIQPKGNQPLDANLVNSVRYLVASSVSGLKPEAITVVDLGSNRNYPGTNGADSRAGGMIGDYADYKTRLEELWQEKIARQLSYIPNVIVGVNVELDPEITNEKTSIEYDAKSVTYESRESSLTKTIDSGPPAGRPGVVAQGGVANQAAAVASASSSKNNEDTSQTEQKKAVPTTQEHIVREGRTPKRVTVSVAVPNNYYEEVWHKQNPVTEGQPEKKPDATALGDLQMSEKKKIEDSILRLVPIQDRTADAYPQVTVSTFYPVSSPPLPEPTAQDTVLVWLSQYWTTLGTIMLAMFSLVMLRSMVRAPLAMPGPLATLELTADAPLSAATAGGEALREDIAAAESSARGRLKRRTVGGPSLKEELAGIVKEDPEAAVAILRSWIGTSN